MKSLHTLTFTLVIIGALNWGLDALGYNVVHMILGSISGVEKIVYILVGLSAVYEIATHKKNCRKCTEGKMGAQM